MNVTKFISPWDGRRWTIKQHLTCTNPNVIYKVECQIHKDFIYIGSTVNLKSRWANHKCDARGGKAKKCRVAAHVKFANHPEDDALSYLVIVAIEQVENEGLLLQRELYWQANLGTLINHNNERNDINSILRHRVQFKAS